MCKLNLIPSCTFKTHQQRRRRFTYANRSSSRPLPDSSFCSLKWYVLVERTYGLCFVVEQSVEILRSEREWERGRMYRMYMWQSHTIQCTVIIIITTCERKVPQGHWIGYSGRILQGRRRIKCILMQCNQFRVPTERNWRLVSYINMYWGWYCYRYLSLAILTL